MNALENTHAAHATACQGSDCAAVNDANDWFGDVECTPASEQPAAQARRDAYGDFA
ncbi:MAG TPA: hypothetical protein VN066_10410 [Rhodocyclaceae bacterium]|nr:hypothetical protein [Rhodocyclaceae bacterium]